MLKFYSSARLTYQPAKQTKTLLIVPNSWGAPLQELGPQFKNTDKTFNNQFFSCLLDIIKKNPELQVTIKTKRPQHSNITNILNRCANNSGLNLEEYPNLKFEGGTDFHSVLQNSDVVCGLNSSALLESAITGRHVILPIFSSLGNVFDDLIWFKDNLNCFTVVNEPSELESTILRSFENPVVSDELIDLRFKLFNRYFAMENNVLEETVDCISRCMGSGSNKNVQLSF